MNIFNKFFSWYFRRTALPYWYIIIFDTVLCFFGGLFILWLRQPLSAMMNVWPALFHSFLVYAVLNLVGFKVFHTYSGILRYSQFVDLLKVIYASMLSFVLASVFNFVVDICGLSMFYHVTERMLLAIYMGTMTVLCLSRICIKLTFDNVFVSPQAERTLIYGTHDGSISVTNEIRSTKPVRFVVAGYLSDDKDSCNQRLFGKRIYHVDDNLEKIIKEERIRVLMVGPLVHNSFVNNTRLQDAFVNAGVRIYIAQSAEEWSKDKKSVKKVQLREMQVEDLLPRKEIEVDLESVRHMLKGRRVMITGSAGSIGSEIVRQVASFEPAEMMLIDQAETPQHDMRLMMKKDFPNVKAHTIVTSICHSQRMDDIFSSFKPECVFHAAAYKHVPMMEDNPSESIYNNVLGTKILADLCVKYDVKKFVMISTDKAVNPTNVMGCSKRICEIYVQSLDHALRRGTVKGVTQFVTTRFGNVLGSNGSVIPLFRKQLLAGGPLTVTHPDIIRYFMLIPEACKLVLEAGTNGKGGEILVFDMGKPVRIDDLARRMIQLSGATDVKIEYTGLREGEKLYEEVLSVNEGTLPSFHEKIRVAQVREYDYEAVQKDLEDLFAIAQQYNDMDTVRKMKEIVPEYVSKHSRYEVLDKPAKKD